MSALRDTMMHVVDRWETSPWNEKEKALKLFLDDVKLNLDNLLYRSKDDLFADLEVIKMLNSLFQPQRIKHRRNILRAVFDETRANQGILEIQRLMADMLCSGEANEMPGWMKRKMVDAGSKKDIKKYLRRSKEREESLISELKGMGVKVENLKHAKRKYMSIKAVTEKDWPTLKKIYSHLEKKLSCASSEHTKLCETELPFDEYSTKTRQCLRRLKEKAEQKKYQVM